jgi:hypothetical protein
MEEFIASFENLAFCMEGISDVFFSENPLSVASRMIFVSMSSWIALKFGWKILSELRKNNMLSLLKPENHPFSLP